MPISASDIRDKLDNCIIYPGIRFDALALMTLDHRYYLYRIEHPPSPLFIGAINEEFSQWEDMAFYSNFFAYTHDVPTVFRSLKEGNSSPVKPIIKVQNNDFIDNDSSYYDEHIQGIFDSIVGIKLNGLVKFRWEKAYYKTININVPNEFLNSKKELQLYSMALKQADPLSEFLCYYRIIESISGNNGKDWIKNNLSKINKYNFGFLELVHPFKRESEKLRRRNVFSDYRRKAIKRINELVNHLNGTPIEKYLYNEIRCGIAHGKENIKTHDNFNTVQQISQDSYIMKLLARIAIETNLTN